MAIFSVAITLFCLEAAWENGRAHDWLDVLAEPLALFVLLGIFVVWPFRIAVAVRKRGGKFVPWFTCAVIFNSVLVGLLYLARYNGKPVLIGEALSDDERNLSPVTAASDSQT